MGGFAPKNFRTSDPSDVANGRPGGDHSISGLVDPNQDGQT